MTQPRPLHAHSDSWRTLAMGLGCLLTLSAAAIIALSSRGLPCALG